MPPMHAAAAAREARNPHCTIMNNKQSLTAAGQPRKAGAYLIFISMTLLAGFNVPVHAHVHVHVLYMLDIETRTGVIFRKVAWCWWNKWTEVFASVLKVYGRIHEIMEVNGRILTTCAR